MAESFYGARREFLIRVHQQVWYAGSRAILPLLLITYGVHAVTNPCWQATVLLLVTLALVVCWYLSWRNAREGRLREAVVILTSSSVLLALSVLVLREQSEMTAAVALLTLFTYVALFSDRALKITVGICAPLFALGLLSNHFGVIPRFGQSQTRSLVQMLAYTFVFFPIAAYFLRAGQRINEQMWGEIQRTSTRKLEVLESVGQVQPVLDQAIAALRPMADAFAVTASEQAATSSQMGATAQRVAQTVGETASAAKSTRETTEKIRDNAAQGREKLRDVEGRFEAAVKRIESVRRQIDELAAEVAKTEAVNRAIHEIAKNLTVMGINATLEAARAGEAGVGFRVVAGELQKLVAQTTADLHQANQILEHLRARAAVIAQDADASTADLQASYERLVAASSLLEGITSSFESASKSVEGIAGAAEQQRSGIGEISAGIQDLVQVAGKLSEAGRGLREGLERVEGAHGQLREILSKQ